MNAHLHNPLGLFGHLHHAPAFDDRSRQGLLEVDVLSRLASIDHLERVPVVGGRHDDRIDVGLLEKFSVVDEAGRLCSGRLDGMVEVVLPYVAHSGDLLVRKFLRCPQQVVAAVPYADKAPPDAVIRAQHALVAQGRQRGGAFLGKSSARGCRGQSIDIPILVAH